MSTSAFFLLLFCLVQSESTEFHSFERKHVFVDTTTPRCNDAGICSRRYLEHPWNPTYHFVDHGDTTESRSGIRTTGQASVVAVVDDNNTESGDEQYFPILSRKQYQPMTGLMSEQWQATGSVVATGVPRTTAASEEETPPDEEGYFNSRNREEETGACGVSFRDRRLQLEALISASVTPLNVLYDAFTPQNKAFHWLLHEDETYVCPDDTKTVIQRYVLAVLYFAMGEWSPCQEGTASCGEPFLSASNVCEWDHVICPKSSTTVVELEIKNSPEVMGYLPLELANLEILHSLSITGNPGLTRKIPVSVGQFHVLRNLHLDRNHLYGPLPTQLCRLVTLQTLRVAHNELTGEIPACLGSIGNLRTLDVSYNAITGTLPAEIFQSISCRVLRLNNNNITGTIPNEIGSLATAVDLSLQRNSLTGSLPSSMATLENLQFLSLFGNALTGTIPSTLGELHQLERLFLHLNELSGTMPQEICNLRLDRGGKLAHLTADCATGNMECDCCTACY